MDKLVLTDTGGFPLKLDDLLWMNGRLDAANKGVYDAIQAQLLALGTDFIVEGCTYAAPNITAGWIMLDSELMRVDAAAGSDNYFVRTVTFDARGSKTFKDTTVNNTYEKIRGVLSGASGSLNITTAKRLEDKMIQLLATSAEQFAAANIPNIDASKITSGTLDRNTTGTASAWTTARTISLGGDLSGSVAIKGDADVNLIASVTDNSHSHNGTTISSLDAGDTTTGTFQTARIPGLDAAQIIQGIFAAARLPLATTTAGGAVEKATATEVVAGTADKFIDALLLQSHGSWAIPSYVDNHSDYTTGDFSGLRYRKLTNGMIQIAGSYQRSSVNAGIVFTLNSGFRPAQTLPVIGRREDDEVVGGSISSAGVFTCFLDSAVADTYMNINIIFPTDLTV